MQFFSKKLLFFIFVFMGSLQSLVIATVTSDTKIRVNADTVRCLNLFNTLKKSISARHGLPKVQECIWLENCYVKMRIGVVRIAALKRLKKLKDRCDELRIPEDEAFNLLKKQNVFLDLIYFYEDKFLPFYTQQCNESISFINYHICVGVLDELFKRVNVLQELAIKDYDQKMQLLSGSLKKRNKNK